MFSKLLDVLHGKNMNCIQFKLNLTKNKKAINHHGQQFVNPWKRFSLVKHTGDSPEKGKRSTNRNLEKSCLTFFGTGNKPPWQWLGVAIAIAISIAIMGCHCH